jgi:hypothetical protein
VQIDFTNTSLPTTYVDQGGSTIPNVSFIEQVQVVTASSTAQFHLIDGTAESLTVGFPQFTNKFPSNSLGTDSTLDTRVASGLTPANSNTEHSFPIATSPWQPQVAAVNSELATNSANIDRVNSLAIAAPGLASGVHMNGDAGACTLCRFPVTGSRGSVIQYVPIIPIKSTYPLQGSTLSDINIELLDQNGESVDTQDEGFSLTLVVEYDMD